MGFLISDIDLLVDNFTDNARTLIIKAMRSLSILAMVQNFRS